MARIRNAKDFAKAKIVDQAKQTIENLDNNDYAKGKISSEIYESAFRSRKQDQDVHDNILHKFATYNTLFTLSGINEAELANHTFLTNPVHDVIARSGGIGNPNVSGNPASADISAPGDQDEQGSVAEREIEAQRIESEYGDSIGVLKKGRDIFFESVNMISTVGPSEERGLADFIKMDFKLHEPFGITFVEKIRAAARLNDYKDYQDAPMLLTIEFKGFDENGRPMDQYGTVRKIPILITRVDLDVNEGGAIYDVTAVRINDMAFDDRFKFPRRKISINASTLRGAASQLEDQLNEQILKERDEHEVRTVLDKYIISIDDKVAAISKGFIGAKEVQNTAVSPKARRNGQNIKLEVAEAQVSSLVSLTKLLEDMVRSTKGYEDLAADFWTEYLQRAGEIGPNEDATEEKIEELIKSDRFEQTIRDNSFVDWFKIKTSVQTDYSKFDKINKMHRKIVTYKVIPYKIHVLKFMRPGVFMKRNSLSAGIKKRYNYLYTGDNVDIQNLRINYKTAFYMRNTVEVGKGPQSVFEKLDNLITKLVGQEDPDNKDITGIRSYASIVKSRNLINKADTDLGLEARKQDFYDYLTNPTVDMMRIEMEILGDPAYLCQDQFIPLNARGEARKEGTVFDDGYGSFNADQYTPLMELIYRLPDDLNDKTGVMFESFDPGKTVPEENLFFSGVYQVVKIDSSMSNGQFTQTLTCVRLNNQQGDGVAADIIAKSSAKLTKFLKKAKDEGPNTFVKDKIRENIDKKVDDLIGTLPTGS